MKEYVDRVPFLEWLEGMQAKHPRTADAYGAAKIHLKHTAAFVVHEAGRQRHIEWELENTPKVYEKPRCNDYIDRQTLTHVICNVDCPEGVAHEDFIKVLNEIAETLDLFPYFKL